MKLILGGLAQAPTQFHRDPRMSLYREISMEESQLGRQPGSAPKSYSAENTDRKTQSDPM